VGVGSVSVFEKFSLREVAFVSKLGFNLLSVSQLLDEGCEVCFKKGCSRVLDAKGELVCKILPFGRIFQIDFSRSLALRVVLLVPVLLLLVFLSSGSGIGG